jgi:hypothetical protein
MLLPFLPVYIETDSFRFGVFNLKKYFYQHKIFGAVILVAYLLSMMTSIRLDDLVAITILVAEMLANLRPQNVICFSVDL